MKLTLSALLWLPLVLGCSQSPSYTPPVAKLALPTEVRRCVVAEPSAAHSPPFGTLYTLHFVEGLGSIENVQLFPMGNATGAESNGSLPISKDELPDLLSHAEPVSPDDELIEAWHYAPYYHAMFSYHGRNWTASLLLGGLGMITDDQGRTAAFKYKQRALKMSANSKEQ